MSVALSTVKCGVKNTALGEVMDEFVSALVSALPTEACGCTIDWHRGNSDGRVVQWLWAKPAAEVSTADVESGVLALARITGFQPGSTDGFQVNLPNAVEVLETCPFQPATCEGPHVVASGSGRF